MAPEQLSDAPVTPAIDVYALAAVAFEVLSGIKARREPNAVALAHAIATQGPPSLREAWPRAPHGLDELLQRGMARDPRERPRTATRAGRPDAGGARARGHGGGHPAGRAADPAAGPAPPARRVAGGRAGGPAAAPPAGSRVRAVRPGRRTRRPRTAPPRRPSGPPPDDGSRHRAAARRRRRGGDAARPRGGRRGPRPAELRRFAETRARRRRARRAVTPQRFPHDGRAPRARSRTSSSSSPAPRARRRCSPRRAAPRRARRPPRLRPPARRRRRPRPRRHRRRGRPRVGGQELLHAGGRPSLCAGVGARRPDDAGAAGWIRLVSVRAGRRPLDHVHLGPDDLAQRLSARVSIATTSVRTTALSTAPAPSTSCRRRSGQWQLHQIGINCR